MACFEMIRELDIVYSSISSLLRSQIKNDAVVVVVVVDTLLSSPYLSRVFFRLNA